MQETQKIGIKGQESTQQIFSAQYSVIIISEFTKQNAQQILSKRPINLLSCPQGTM